MWSHIQDDLLHCLILEDESTIILWNIENYSPPRHSITSQEAWIFRIPLW
jgi:hypothetical protein